MNGQPDKNRRDEPERANGACSGAQPPGNERAVELLQALQADRGYLPAEALEAAAEECGMSLAELYGVASFYPSFRLRPAGRHDLKICVGTACHVKGAAAVADAFRRALKIPDGDDTDAGRIFTVREVACLGCCMLAPVVQIDDVTYGRLDASKVHGVLRDFLSSVRSGKGERAAQAKAPAAGELRLCTCSSCAASGSEKVLGEILRLAPSLAPGAAIKVVGCSGESFASPVLEAVTAGGGRFSYGMVKPADARGILVRHFRPASAIAGAGAKMLTFLDRWITGDDDGPVLRYSGDARDARPDSRAQVRIATADSGEDDPLDLEAYRRRGGFAQFMRVSGSGDRQAVLDEIERSGLRGRGGAGFPTGLKWKSVASMSSPEKYVICNGDEGDPGAFMDRMIVESFPFRVIEGAAVAAFAVGAAEILFYVRAEYPLAIRRLGAALDSCVEAGILGRGGSGRPGPSARVIQGAGAFVCGEETALIEAVSGRRGNPRFRPPYPAEKGFRGMPTLVNNVETLALVPWILTHGAGAFAALGSKMSRGTKTFALAGKIARGGLIEVPMGQSIRSIVEDLGGGVEGGKKLKAVQIGGPSGGLVPASMADTPVDYEALAAAGAIMGSGGMVVLDETDCMVDVARYFLAFTQRESCGRCAPCRVGTLRLLEILDRLRGGKGKKGDVEELERLGKAVAAGSLCGLGRTAPNPLLSTLAHFRWEYDAHVEGRCPAGKCKALINYFITDDCIGCTRCAQRCPAEAIEMRPHEKHSIDAARCVRCGTCAQVCPSGAVKVR